LTIRPTTANETGVLRDTVPGGARWLLTFLTLLLAVLLAYQLTYFVPRCSWVMQQFGVREPGYLRLLLRIPEWAVLALALAFAVAALWQRNSMSRSVLFALLAMAANVGCLVCILGSLFQLLSRVQSP